MVMVVTRLSHGVDGRTSVVVLKRSAGTIPEHVFVAAGALALVDYQIVIIARFMAIFHMHRFALLRWNRYLRYNKAGGVIPLISVLC